MVCRIIFVILLVIGLAGCATTSPRVSTASNEELQARINELERIVEQKDEEIRSLEGQTLVSQRDIAVTNVSDEEFTKLTPKMIQSALKSAGFYSGSVDGKIGKNTRRAIREFQRNNGLKADGVVGRMTWSRLKGYTE